MRTRRASGRRTGTRKLSWRNKAAGRSGLSLPLQPSRPSALPRAPLWLDDVDPSRQLLVRAAIYRIATSAEIALVPWIQPSEVSGPRRHRRRAQRPDRLTHATFNRCRSAVIALLRESTCNAGDTFGDHPSGWDSRIPVLRQGCPRTTCARGRIQRRSGPEPHEENPRP